MTAATATAKLNTTSTFLAPRRAERRASLALAALMTLAVLASLHSLAGSESALVQQALAQAASAPRI